MKKFIAELGVVPSCVDPVTLYCDNNGVIAQAREPRSHQKSKHVLRRFHLIREIIGRGDVAVERVSSENNIADPLSKTLSQNVFESHRSLMEIRYVGDWLQCKWEIVSDECPTSQVTYLYEHFLISNTMAICLIMCYFYLMHGDVPGYMHMMVGS